MNIMSKAADLHTCMQNRIFCGAQCPVDIGSAWTGVERRKHTEPEGNVKSEKVGKKYAGKD